MTNLKDIAKHPNLAGVSIVDGPPSVEVNQLGEWIMFGDVDGQQEWATLNNVSRPKNEIYTLQCWIDVVLATDADQSTVNRRALTLFAEVENELRTSPDQALAHVVASAIKRPYRMSKNSTDQWRECWLVAGIEVKARI